MAHALQNATPVPLGLALAQKHFGSRPSLTVNRLSALARSIVGLDHPVPIAGGERRYINFDNAATTPALGGVKDALDRFLECYSSVHRGSGWKSRLSTEVYEQSRQAIAEFVGANDRDVIVIGRNTTDMVNRLSNRLGLDPDDIVLVSDMEHHSNDLPWRRVARVVRVPVDDRGAIMVDALWELFSEANGRAKILAVSGGSNVTGFVQDVHALARVAHTYGARILVDAAQVAAHRRLEIHSPDPMADLDFVVFSAHKIYAPFGTGVLVGPRHIFESTVPDQVGGGTVDIVTADEVYWAASPDRDDPGTPNVIGALALAHACRLLEWAGLETIEAHERKLTELALERLRAIPSVRLYGETSCTSDRLGVISFNVEHMNHSLVASALGWESGVGVRSGCFCAHPFVSQILGIDDLARKDMIARVTSGDRRDMPGLVRMSFGLYNTEEEVSYACDELARIAADGPKGQYQFDPETGDWSALGSNARVRDEALAHLEIVSDLENQ
jgi:selenocysteine lyase/cysteine desulfurase